MPAEGPTTAASVKKKPSASEQLQISCASKALHNEIVTSASYAGSGALAMRKNTTGSLLALMQKTGWARPCSDGACLGRPSGSLPGYVAAGRPWQTTTHVDICRQVLAVRDPLVIALRQATTVLAASIRTTKRTFIIVDPCYVSQRTETSHLLFGPGKGHEELHARCWDPSMAWQHLTQSLALTTSVSAGRGSTKKQSAHFQYVSLISLGCIGGYRLSQIKHARHMTMACRLTSRLPDQHSTTQNM